MCKIKLNTNLVFNDSVNTLKEDFDKIVKPKLEMTNFTNTESSLIKIIQESLDYFDSLDSNFLGKESTSCTPNMETDHFANTFYRLSNSLDYIYKLLTKKDSFSKPNEWNILIDIRTLIAHSGEQISNLHSPKSLEFEKYKDAQLEFIIKKGNTILSKLTDIFDYCIQISTDNHDKSKNRPKNEVDYDNRKNNFKEIRFLVNSKDIKNIIFYTVKSFIDEIDASIPNDYKNKKERKMPKEVKEIIVNNLDIDKLEKFIYRKKRGGYIIESGEPYWFGFGLKRILNYIEYNESISNKVKQKIRDIISTRLDEFCSAYNDRTIDDFKLPSLDIRDIFKQYTPCYEAKSYFEGQKLFENIAPTFNKKENLNSVVDIDYLIKFIIKAQEALKNNLNIEIDVNSIDVNSLVCDYFVKSVEMKLKEKI